MFPKLLVESAYESFITGLQIYATGQREPGPKPRIKTSDKQIPMTSKYSYLIGFVFAIFMLASCDSSNMEEDDPVLTPVRDSLFVQDSTGIKYFDIINGPFDGPVVEGDLLLGTFRLWLASDSSYIDEIEFLYDAGTSIDQIGTLAPVNRGWVLGLYGMHEGGRRQIVVPDSLGFGAQGSSDWGIPGNATLIYETFISQRDPGGL